MSPRGRLALLAASLLVGGAAWRGARWQTARVEARDRAAAIIDAEREAGVRARDIAFYEARAARDAEGAFDRARLAALYGARARESGDFEDQLRAERAARASLAARTSRNGDAYAALVASLLAQHRFVEARDAARALVALEPDIPAYRATLGETCLELGDYDGAHAAFATIPGRARASLAVAPRLARWAEIVGDTAAARRIVRRARAAADSAPLSREQRAWFHLRAGDLELRQGRAALAEREYRAGLAAHPDDARLLAARARLAAARHEWQDAILLGDSAVAAALDPATLGVVADAWAALGDRAKADEYGRAMEAAVGQQPGAYHRAWSLFLLDHDRRVPEVLAAARAEVAAGRRDVHGWDLLAWALYRSGRIVEARQAASAALARGTQDPLLLFHAGMIARAAGDAARARAYLSRALAVSDVFDPVAPAVARAVLDTLARAGAGTTVAAR